MPTLENAAASCKEQSSSPSEASAQAGAMVPTPERSPVEQIISESEYPCNWEWVAQLKEENGKLAGGYGILTTAAVAFLYLSAPLVAAGGVVAGSYFTWRAEKVIRSLQMAKAILTEFESQGVLVYGRIAIADDMNPIDLFIRFPKRAHLIISLRSKGDNEIIYNEATENLHVKKKNGKTSKWNPNPLAELADQERWIGKNGKKFGMSAKDAQKTSTAKVLAVYKPTRVDQHREELYSPVGDRQALAIRRKGTAFVIQQEEVIDFIKAWLKRCDEKAAA